MIIMHEIFIELIHMGEMTSWIHREFLSRQTPHDHYYDENYKVNNKRKDNIRKKKIKQTSP